jgi:hypothetical protein
MLRYAISNLDTPEHGIEAVTARAYEGSGEHVCALDGSRGLGAVCGVDLTHSTGRRNWRPT